MRAGLVRDALLELGVSPELIALEGASSAQPVASNDTASGQALNRRVDVFLVAR